MPVDPHVFATTDEEITEQAVRALAADLAEGVGIKRFRDFDNRGIVHLVPRDEYYDLPDSLPQTPSILTVRLDGAYYGPGYERGYWPEIAAVLEFLRRRLPDAKVWYGRDDGDWVREVTAESLDALWAHWARHGGRPYYRRESKG